MQNILTGARLIKFKWFSQEKTWVTIRVARPLRWKDGSTQILEIPTRMFLAFSGLISCKTRTFFSSKMARETWSVLKRRKQKQNLVYYTYDYILSQSQNCHLDSWQWCQKWETVKTRWDEAHLTRTSDTFQKIWQFLQQSFRLNMLKLSAL